MVFSRPLFRSGILPAAPQTNQERPSTGGTVRGHTPGFRKKNKLFFDNFWVDFSKWIFSMKNVLFWICFFSIPIRWNLIILAPFGAAPRWQLGLAAVGWSLRALRALRGAGGRDVNGYGPLANIIPRWGEGAEHPGNPGWEEWARAVRVQGADGAEQRPGDHRPGVSSCRAPGGPVSAVYHLFMP